jgi:hypothetical protein
MFTRFLLRLVNVARLREASDARDKIFGVLGLAEDRDDYPSQLINYNMSFGDVYR